MSNYQNPILFTLAIAFAGIAYASPGQYQINAACQSVGCFPGDNPATETVEITQESGTFVLTGSLSTSQLGVPLIAVDNVNNRSNIIIDLNGFALRHNGVANADTNGIEISGQNAIVTVRNGKIAAFHDNIHVNDGGTLIAENLILRIARDDAIQASIGAIRHNVFDANNYAIHAPTSGSFSHDRLRIDENLFIDDTATQDVAFSLGSSNYCRDNVIGYAEPSDQFGTCVLVGSNLCDDTLCSVSRSTSALERKE